METDDSCQEQDGTGKDENVMLKRIAASDCAIISQQRGDEELSIEDKAVRLRAILKRSPETFLFRFGEQLTETDLQCFTAYTNEFGVSFYINQIRDRLNGAKIKLTIRNRRYECLQRLEAQGDYFGEEEMRKRCPYLYEQYIGKYLSQEERDKLANQQTASPTLSSFLLQQLEEMQTKALLEHRREREEETFEEKDDDSDDEDIPSSVTGDSDDLECKNENCDVKARYREEFLRLMKTRFLDGEDSEFDYSKVDYNVEYDPLTVRGQDQEDAYFDDEEPETCSDYKKDNDNVVIENYEDDKFAVDAK